MSISSLFGGGRDERPSLDAAVIRPLKNGFLFDPDLSEGSLRGATACVTPEDLAAAVLAWARDVSTTNPAPKAAVKSKPAKKPAAKA